VVSLLYKELCFEHFISDSNIITQSETESKTAIGAQLCDNSKCKVEVHQQQLILPKQFPLLKNLAFVVAE
jgi:hypothetical protein